MKQFRVKGHVLANEGAPFETYLVDGKPKRSGGPWGGISGMGCGLCSCGVMSEVLPSATKRKAWHRNHKDEILLKQEQESLL